MFLLLCFTQEYTTKAREMPKSIGSSRERKGKKRVRPQILYAPRLPLTGLQLEEKQFTWMLFQSWSHSSTFFCCCFFLNFSSSFFLCKYISPAPHFMLYYSQIANALGPLIHLWRMHFEAKLNILKWLVHGVLILEIAEKH